MKQFSRFIALTACLLLPVTGYSYCKARELQGLYGLTTQSIGSDGVESTTLSLFDFKSNNLVDETYFVNAINKTTVNATASGKYTVARDCSFTLLVADSGGGAYGLTGQLNPKTKEVSVLQTIPNNVTVSMGVMHPVGLSYCGPQTFKGRYAFLSGGRVPSMNNASQRVPESRVGWFNASKTELLQPVQLINQNGVVTESAPTTIPSKILPSCLMNISNGGFTGVVINRGKMALYMDLSAGSTRVGMMSKVRQ